MGFYWSFLLRPLPYNFNPMACAVSLLLCPSLSDSLSGNWSLRSATSLSRSYMKTCSCALQANKVGGIFLPNDQKGKEVSLRVWQLSLWHSDKNRLVKSTLFAPPPPYKSSSSPSDEQSLLCRPCFSCCLSSLHVSLCNIFNNN